MSLNMSELDILFRVIEALVASFIAGVGLYLAIRIDLTKMHERISSSEKRIEVVAKETDKAHERIDAWYRRESRHDA